MYHCRSFKRSASQLRTGPGTGLMAANSTFTLLRLLSVCSTLICNVLFITCNVTQTHHSRYYWRVGRFTQRSRWLISAYLITESRLERRLICVLRNNNCKIIHYFTWIIDSTLLFLPQTGHLHFVLDEGDKEQTWRKSFLNESAINTFCWSDRLKYLNNCWQDEPGTNPYDFLWSPDLSSRSMRSTSVILW